MDEETERKCPNCYMIISVHDRQCPRCHARVLPPYTHLFTDRDDGIYRSQPKPASSKIAYPRPQEQAGVLPALIAALLPPVGILMGIAMLAQGKQDKGAGYLGAAVTGRAIEGPIVWLILLNR